MNPKRNQTRRGARKRPAFHPRRILVPLDFTRQSERAIEVASALARTYGAAITLLHVVPAPVYPPDSTNAVLLNEHSILAAARTRLSELGRKWLPAALLEKTVVRSGFPGTVIPHAAARMKLDLIVITTHGRTGLKRAFLGSTAESVVRHAHCPVLTVRRPDRGK